MDRETAHVLGRISARIPRHLAENTTMEIEDTADEQLAIAALQDPEVSAERRQELSDLIGKGAFRHREEVVNEEVVAEIDRYNTREVQRAMRSGRLKDPMTDPFYRARMRRLQLNPPNPKGQDVMTPQQKRMAARALRNAN